MRGRPGLPVGPLRFSHGATPSETRANSGIHDTTAHEKARTWRAQSVGVVVVRSDEALVFHLAAALAGVATVAHGLERPVPKVAALRDREDVVDNARQLAAVHAERMPLQPCQAQRLPLA